MTRYGAANALPWDRLHPRLTRRAAWLDHGDPPVLEGTLIRLTVRHPPRATVTRNRCGCGRPAPASVRLMGTTSGRRSCAGSTFRVGAGEAEQNPERRGTRG